MRKYIYLGQDVNIRIGKPKKDGRPTYEWIDKATGKITRKSPSKKTWGWLNESREKWTE